MLNPGPIPLPDDLLEHERNHSNQSASFGGGVGFGLAYAGDWLWHGARRECMWFETAADAQKGHYGPCAAYGAIVGRIAGAAQSDGDLCDRPKKR